MKNAVLLICMALLLASCQSIPALQPSSTPLPPAPTNTPTQTFTPVSPTSTPTPTFTPIPPTSTPTPSPSREPTLLPAANKKNDYLVYQVNSLGQKPTRPQFALYDPTNNASRVLLPYLGSYDFSLSRDNRLAFEKDGNIYVWDYPFAENTQSEINFDGSPKTHKEVLSWSLDGRYLLLTGVDEKSNVLFLWDGKHILDLYRYQGVISSGGTAWSNNDKLAFTERSIYNNNYVSDWGDIYAWDGKRIVKVSQDPSGSPVWSKDGHQLAFRSYQTTDRKYTISVWDGKSTNNGAPDVKILAVPDLEISINSIPSWTNSGLLAFTGRGKTDRTNQIYEWDGQTTRNISQTLPIDFSRLAWRNDGYWSVATYQDSAPHYAVFIHDNANRTILETEGTDSEWTQSGLLVICTSRDNHTVSIWNGKTIVDVATGDSVFAEWTNSNGKFIWCTYG